MAFNSIYLTPADAVAQKEIFLGEMADLLGSRQFAILPPFPDYSLLSQYHSPKALGFLDPGISYQRLRPEALLQPVRPGPGEGGAS